MSIRIYERDAYVAEFEAAVTDADKEWIGLDITAFYPGGGGQTNDTGKICGLDVTDVKANGDSILHKVPGHSLKKGDTVWCSVDWTRRYDLMKGHTAEHLFFGALKHEVPEINIVKIFISPESKYVTVDRDVPWDVIKNAQTSVNASIRDNLSVTKSTMSKDDADADNVRMKTERIDGDLVTVVEIGDVDIAACSGIHVMETGEIGALFADRKVSAGKDGYEIHFRVGDDAVIRSMELANVCLQTVEIIGSKTEDAVKAAQNIKNDLAARTEQLRSALLHIISGLQPSAVNGTPVFSAVLPANDRTVITNAAERIKNEGGVSVFLTIGDTLTAYMSSGMKSVDCAVILKDVMTKNSGKAGGKADFAQGGSPDASKANGIMKELLRRVERSLEQKIN